MPNSQSGNVANNLPLSVGIWELEVGSCLAPGPSGQKHTLDHPPLVHAVEGVAPAVETRAKADDEFRAREAGSQQLDHTFPNRPVVAERSLEPHVLLHERVHV